MPRRIACFAAVLAFALLAACTPQKPYSDAMFYGNCIIPFGPDPCDSDMDICQAFQGVFTTTFSDAKTCRAACNKVFVEQGNIYIGRNCFYMIDHGGDLCAQQCDRLYPTQK